MFAMHVHLRVALAFFRAGPARDRASIDHPAHRFVIAAVMAQQHGPGRQTHVGAVEIEPDELGEVFHHVFGEAGIGAGMAHPGTVEAGLDALRQGLRQIAVNARMARQHVSQVHGLLLR